MEPGSGVRCVVTKVTAALVPELSGDAVDDRAWVREQRGHAHDSAGDRSYQES